MAPEAAHPLSYSTQTILADGLSSIRAQKQMPSSSLTDAATGSQMHAGLSHSDVPFPALPEVAPCPLPEKCPPNPDPRRAHSVMGEVKTQEGSAQDNVGSCRMRDICSPTRSACQEKSLRFREIATFSTSKVRTKLHSMRPCPGRLSARQPAALLTYEFHPASGYWMCPRFFCSVPASPAKAQPKARRRCSPPDLDASPGS